MSGAFSFKQQDLTEGRIAPLLIKFAIPYMLANLLQALYGAADMIIVGQFTNAAGLSAVAIGSQFMMFINGLVIGMSMGGTILIGQYFGAGNDKEIKSTIATMFTLFAIIGAVLTVALLFAVKPLVAVLKTPPEAVAQAEAYIYVNVAGILFMFAYNALSAMLRGFGDSKSPLLFVAIACVCNVFGDLLLVGRFGMGAGGAALATILSQGLSALLAVVFLKKQSFNRFDFKLKSFRMDADKVKKLFVLGLPMSAQMSLTTVSFMFIMATVNQMGGVVASAAIGVSGRINGFTMLPPTAFSAAISAVVAQNMGARRPKRARTALYVGIAVSLAFGVVSYAILFFCPHILTRVFTPDRELIAAAALYFRSFSLDCVLVCFVFCLNGFFNGCGHTPFSMANNLLAAFLIRVPATWILSGLDGASLFTVGFAAPLASSVSIVIGLLYLKYGKWHKIRI
ncbi:MAG: MATE family efflux transporter [Synergistaceae bacterium]|nr:MATE family efflux transporter [Synergistaceae bacterium]